MTSDSHHLFVTRDQPQEAGGFVRRLLRESAVQDWVVVLYLVALNWITWQTADSAGRTLSLKRIVPLSLFSLTTLLIVRGGLIKHRFSIALLYRLGIYGAVQLSYFFLGGLLPIVNTTTLDVELYHFDLHSFGFEPAMAMDAIVNPITGEWFAFFYFGYFFLLALHVIPIMMGSQRQRLVGEFALGMVLLFCAGHLLYMVVPGYGPYKAFEQSFQHQLPSGMWVDMVMATVSSGGAQMDIFPSLHTAAPTFLALFAFRHRRLLPYRYSWLPMAFVALNIVGATMFLRWHYIIDVVAGLTLASTVHVLSVYITRREILRRQGSDLSANWPLFVEEPANQLRAPPTSVKQPDRQSLAA